MRFSALVCPRKFVTVSIQSPLDVWSHTRVRNTEKSTPMVNKEKRTRRSFGDECREEEATGTQYSVRPGSFMPRTLVKGQIHPPSLVFRHCYDGSSSDTRNIIIIITISNAPPGARDNFPPLYVITCAYNCNNIIVRTHNTYVDTSRRTLLGVVTEGLLDLWVYK